MAYRKVGEYKLNDKNPFLDQTVLHVEKGEKVYLMASKGPDLIIDGEGAVRGHSLFARKIEVDKAQFTKVFVDGMGNWFELSKAGIRVFSYIISILKPNRDEFSIRLDAALKHTKYKSKKTILSGLAELLENKFIARGQNPYHYFINPTIFFNGNRLTFVNQYLLRESEKNADPQPPQLEP